MTVAAPKKETVAGEVSTKAMDCVTYPLAVKHPASNDIPIRSRGSWDMKGLSAMAAKSIRELVAALAGRAPSIMLPRGKLVPYRHATAANNNLGPM